MLPGLRLARVNRAVIVELGLPLTADGVVVTDPGPYGARIGLQPGDVILRGQRRAIEAHRDVRAALLRGGTPSGWRSCAAAAAPVLRFRV